MKPLNTSRAPDWIRTSTPRRTLDSHSSAYTKFRHRCMVLVEGIEPPKPKRLIYSQVSLTNRPLTSMR